MGTVTREYYAVTLRCAVTVCGGVSYILPVALRREGGGGVIVPGRVGVEGAEEDQ